VIGNLHATIWYASFCCFLRLILLSSLQVYLKRQFFNINVCCFIITVWTMFIRKTLRRLANQLWSYDYFSMSKMATSRHLGFLETENFRSAVPDNPTTELDIMSLTCVAPELCHFEFLDKMAASRHLRFGLTGSSVIWSADPENPIPEPNTKWIGRTVAKIMLIETFQVPSWIWSWILL